MKKALSLVLAMALLAAWIPAAHAGNGWTCPICGQYNEGNYCPYDGTPRPDDYSAGTSYTYYAYQPAVLGQRMATRTGPGTDYDEPGSFFEKGTTVTVLSKAYDQVNGIWWVQVEFTAYNGTSRAYTGAKRLPDLDLNSIPEERIIGTCRTPGHSQTGFYGPGSDYREIKRKVPANVSCTIYGYAYGRSSDYILIEFYDSGAGCKRRAWVPDWSVEDFTMYIGA